MTASFHRGTDIKPGQLKTNVYNFKTKTKRINLATFNNYRQNNGKEIQGLDFISRATNRKKLRNFAPKTTFFQNDVLDLLLR